MRGWRFLGRDLRQIIIQDLFAPMLSQLRGSDIIWCHNWPYVAEGLSIAVRAKGAKLIYHAHNSIAAYAGRSLFQDLSVDSMIFNSEAMRIEALSHFPNLVNTVTIYNGADDNLFFPEPKRVEGSENDPVILFVGRLVPTKGVHVLVEAVNILNKRGLRFTCKLFGSPYSDIKLKSTTRYVRALREKCPPNCTLEGSRSALDIAKEFRNASIFCCPSVWNEPFGLVNIEAMASGLPVVASKVGGIPEIADGGVILVQPNSARDLADALGSLVSDQALREATAELGLASFRRNFRFSKIAQDYKTLANRVVRTAAHSAM